MRRLFFALAICCLIQSFTFAQQATLAETNKQGDTFRLVIDLTIKGKLKTTGPDGKPEELELTASANHKYAELIQTVDDRGEISKVVRGYQMCESEAILPNARTRRILNASRRVVVMQKTAESSTLYSAGGPLTRDELDVVSGHFDSTAVPGLLPGKAVNVGDQWDIPVAVTQSICLFDAVGKNELKGKLIEVKDNIAKFTIEGEAEGTETGAIVKLKLSLTGEFDLTAKRITKITGQEVDSRQQSAVAPACDVVAQLDFRRSIATEPVEELTKTDLGTVPQGNTLPGNLTQLTHDDVNGNYQFMYGRDWHIVAATKDHIVLRLVDKGEFIAQATILNWQKAKPGEHDSISSIKDAIARQPGWKAERMTEDSEIPSGKGRWIYRLTALGKQDDTEVQQSFHILAGPNGNQVAVTVISRPDKAAKIGTRDVELVNSIEFTKK
jgi:hypothetical protein